MAGDDSFDDTQTTAATLDGCSPRYTASSSGIWKQHPDEPSPHRRAVRCQDALQGQSAWRVTTGEESGACSCVAEIASWRAKAQPTRHRGSRQSNEGGRGDSGSKRSDTGDTDSSTAEHSERTLVLTKKDLAERLRSRARASVQTLSERSRSDHDERSEESPGKERELMVIRNASLSVSLAT